MDAGYCCEACRTRDRVRGVALEIARPIALLLCLAALYAVFYTAFLAPSRDVGDRPWDTAALLALSAGIAAASGMLFRERPHIGASGLLRTLPMQVFFWALGVMGAMLLASWYLEAHVVLYRDARWF